MRAWALVGMGLVATLSAAHSQAATKTARVWEYGNFTVAFSPNWSATALGGLRFELSRDSKGAERGVYLYELFLGPNFNWNVTKNLSLKASLWYYYTGFPVLATNSYYFQHSIEGIPAIEYRLGKFSFYDRVILHNTVFANVYHPGSQRAGWGLVIRELLQVRYSATDSLGLILADEPFFGAKRDSQAPVNNGPGYWDTGLRLNRLYAGVDVKLSPSVSFTPMYMYEIAYKSSGAVAEYGHYAFLTLSYVLKLFEPPPPEPSLLPPPGEVLPVAPAAPPPSPAPPPAPNPAPAPAEPVPPAVPPAPPAEL